MITKNLEKHFKYKEFFNPNFNWNNQVFYLDYEFSVEFIELFKDKMDWDTFSYLSDISSEIFFKFKNKINIAYFVLNKNVDKLLRELANKEITDKDINKLDESYKNEYRRFREQI